MVPLPLFVAGPYHKTPVFQTMGLVIRFWRRFFLTPKHPKTKRKTTTFFNYHVHITTSILFKKRDG